jgi:two-component system sensor histidine kinase MprB
MAVARAALVPVDRLTGAAERVAATLDLSSTIDVRGADEVARLGQALNALLASLDQSQQAQRRLVADASHELRTPLTSLRTNLELLERSPDISLEERRAILADLVAQAAELSTLVGQLVDMEREPVGHETRSDVAFDDVVRAALERAKLHAPGLRFEADLEPTVVTGQVGVLERAVANLLDNAAKWSSPGGVVEVKLVGGTLSVRDHGPGIDPSDVPHVFERFYRSAQARALPGSGLGLSIVRQAAEDHDGQAWVLPAPGGGTVVCLRIPVAGPPTMWTAPPPADVALS